MFKLIMGDVFDAGANQIAQVFHHGFDRLLRPAEDQVGVALKTQLLTPVNGVEDMLRRSVCGR